MKPTTIEELCKKHPRQKEIDAEAVALLLATRERMKSPDARRNRRRRKKLEAEILLSQGS